MPRDDSEYPEPLRVRLTTEQMTWLQDQADLSAEKKSDLVRAMIQRGMNEWHAQVSREAGDYLNRLGAMGVVPDAHI